MATLTQLGRNSGSITYSPSITGAEIWPTFALVDKFIRNDTLQGYVTINNIGGTGTANGVGTVFTTELRAGDVVVVRQEKRTVASVVSDTQFTVTTPWTIVNTSEAAAVRFVDYELTGTATKQIRGNTSGHISITNGSTVVTGNGTFFLTEATNNAANTAGEGGRRIVINGRTRVIADIVSNTYMTLTTPMDYTDSRLHYRVMPRGNLTISAGSTIVSGTGTNFNADIVSGDEIWIGDELKTIQFNSGNTNTANITTAMTQAVTNIPFRKDGTYIDGTGTAFTTELRVNDEIIIDGSEYTVTEILSDTLFRIDHYVTDNLDGSTVYKKRKIHGWVLEGTREGSGNTAQQANGKLGIATTILNGSGNVYPAGTNTITVNEGFRMNLNNIIKVQSAGGPPRRMTGQISTVSSSNSVTGIGTSFTTELHVGAEIVIAGQYFVVQSIANTTSMVVDTPFSVTGPVDFYRTSALYTYIAGITGNTITLGSQINNTLYSTGVNAPRVWTAGHANGTIQAVAGGDFIEYIYSAPNKAAEASTTLKNTSNDRKYMGFRLFPLAYTGALATANASYSLPTYERWVASYASAGGVGINLADSSDGVVAMVSQATTVLTVHSMPAGTIHIGTFFSNAVGNVTAFGTGTGGIGTYTVSGSQTLANTTVVGSPGPGAANQPIDVTQGTFTTGGFLYLFANPRYFIIQGKSFANVNTRWHGCVEFERAQPEDASSGTGVTTGVTYSTAPPVVGQTGVSPWPTYGYINGDRFPVGSQLIPSSPVSQSNVVHGCIFSVPRARNSVGDLVGKNSFIYTACTITTGRWGHLYEFGGSGAYQPTNIPVGGILTTNPKDTLPSTHIGHIVPVYTNIYNSKRFMFSPVVILGPAYDPDIRGRFYGLKVIPSALGNLMDTVSITSDSDFFYDSAQSALDHWVLTASVITTRFQLSGNTIQQSYRSLEDGTGPLAINTQQAFTNSFRFAIPA